MKPLIWAAVAVLAGVPSAFAQHAGHDAAPSAANTSWTNLPLVVAGRGGPSGVKLQLVNSAAREIVVTPPKGEVRAVGLEAGAASVKAEVGNYHLVTAEETCDAHTAVASTAVYFSNPGPAPTALLTQEREGLTILPERLPREHGAYRAGDVMGFSVRLNGHPFPGATVKFQTSNGTRTQVTADLDGRAVISFPDDFPPFDQRPPEAHGRPLQADFVVAVQDNSSGTPRLAAFNYTYRPNAYDGTSLWTWAGFAIIGMACAAPFLRRRDKGGRR